MSGFVEGVEDSAAFAWRDARTVVGDPDFGKASGFPDIDPDHRWIAVYCVFRGIVDEIEKDVFDSGGVGADAQGGSAVHAEYSCCFPKYPSAHV